MSMTSWITTLLVSGMAYGLLIVASRWVFELGYQSK